MLEVVPYLLADPWFYETIGRFPIADTYQEIVREILPSDWTIFRKDVWIMATPAGGYIPPQGFKIHISATPENAEEILEVVAPVCRERRLPFKFAADPNLLGFMSSKNYGRGSSSKFFVLYPPSVEEFSDLLGLLDERTKHLAAAYILSDRRFRDSKVLFYRYGGFLPAWRLQADGSRLPVITGPDGEPVEDPRLPYFTLPAWVEEPFGGVREIRQQEGQLLAGRYEPQEALAFSNSGGVYRCLDHETGTEVVLKEARPRTGLWARGDGTFIDAVDILKNEFDVLKRLGEIPEVVQVVELFQEWEHYFLVQEHIEGIPLSNFRAQDGANLLPFTAEDAQLEQFCNTFRTIGLRILALLDRVHALDVILGDLSPSNVLIDPQTLSIRLIDVESALHPEPREDLTRLSLVWSTPGFRDLTPGEHRRLTPRDDYYALGMILQSLILPVTPLQDLESMSPNAIYAKIYSCLGLPREMQEAIGCLLRGEPEAGRRILESWEVASSLRPPIPPVYEWNGKELSPSVLSEAVQEIVRFVLSTVDLERMDRLCPGDSQVFQTDPLSFCFGACGPVLLLYKALGSLPEGIRPWLEKQEFSTQAMPPGLYTGLAGIAYTFAEVGMIDLGTQILDQSHGSPLLFAEANWFEGAAGWGWVNLYYWRRLLEERFLDRAREAAEKILEMGEQTEEGVKWTRQISGERHFGIAYGSIGIGLFLASLYDETKEARYKEAAINATEAELAGALNVDSGLWWGRWEGDEQKTPYWLRGSGGIGSALLRISSYLEEEKYLRIARQIGRDGFTRFSVEPNQLEGMSGLGEFMLDLHMATGESRYLGQAYDLADSLLRYGIDRPEGLGFPGRFLLRLSNDFGTGSSGIGLFLHRLADPGPRPLHDLCPRADAKRVAGLQAVGAGG